MGLLPFTGSVWPAGDAALLGVEIALEAINSNTSLLAGHELMMDSLDTACEVGTGLDAAVQLKSKPPVKPVIFGIGCSGLGMSLAQMTLHWGIPIVSWGAEALDLSDKSRFVSHAFTSFTHQSVELCL